MWKRSLVLTQIATCAARMMGAPSACAQGQFENLTMFSAFSDRALLLIYRTGMRRNHFILATGVCLALIIYASLAALMGRPVLVGHHEAYWVVVIERFSAYGLLGFLLAFLLPGRFTQACLLVIGVAIALELLQALRPDRDAAFFDVIQKAAGGVVGVSIAQIVLAFLPRARS